MNYCQALPYIATLFFQPDGKGTKVLLCLIFLFIFFSGTAIFFQ